MEQQHCKPQRQDLNLAKNYSTFSTRRRRRKEEKSLGKEEERCKNIYKKKALNGHGEKSVRWKVLISPSISG
jgi:hypothetical protein